MGGIGSGRQPTWDKKQIVENCLKLNVSTLCSQTCAEPGHRGNLEWVWGPQIRSTIDFQFHELPDRDRILLLQYRHQSQPVHLQIGLTRTTPIACYPYRGSIAISASNNGLDRHPLWYLNLLANPEVNVQFKSETYRATAVEITGDERDALWQKVIELNPKQAEHQDKTGRTIPLVWLQRH